jgi:uncharacterized membrane protein
LLSEPAIFLAALGITTLELVETSAVSLALHAHSGKNTVYLYASLGTAAVFAPMFALGALIDLLPDAVIRLTAGALLLYFAQRLAKSARRTVLNARDGNHFHEQFHRGTMATAFSVGAVEAFEAAIVLVGLLPNGFRPTVLGMASGIGVVAVSTYLLRDQVRKVKQADMKIAVSALLFSFATFWFGEAVRPLDDLLLIPLFLVYVAGVYRFANRPSPQVPAPPVPSSASGVPGPAARPGHRLVMRVAAALSRRTRLSWTRLRRQRWSGRLWSGPRCAASLLCWGL